MTAEGVKSVYGPLRRFKRGSDRGMSEKGQCEKETERDTKKLLTWFIELEKVEREMKQRDYLVSKIFLAQAKRIDKQEQRLILLEKRVYNHRSSPTNVTNHC